MQWKYRPDLLLAMIVFGLFLMVGLRSGWPLFIVVFWVGPMIFRSLNRATAWEQSDEKAKRKNADFAKSKREAAADSSFEYIVTNDGEVMEVIEDAPARRRNGLI